MYTSWLAALILVELNEKVPQILTVFENALRMIPDKNSRRKTILALGKLKLEKSQVVTGLIYFLKDPSVIVRSTITETLGELKVKKPQVFTALEHSLRDQSEK